MIKRSRAVFILFCLTFFFNSVNAQIDQESFGYYHDAQRFSRTTFGGTARYMGLAGAATALGADAGTMFVNPAGLGFYRKSEFTFSPAFNFANTSTDFLNQTSFDSRQNFNIANIGIVFSGAKDDAEEGSWRGGSFGISLTRMNNFQNQFSYRGLNNKSSMTDYFVEITNGRTLTSLESEYPPNNIYSLSGLAYYTYLINPVDEYNPYETRYYSFITGHPVRQEEIVTTRGNQYQWDIAYGGNFDDRLYLGASLGIPSIRFISERVYKETTEPQDDTLISFRLSDSQKIRGTGINLKFGAVYRANDNLRLGLTIQTPTWYSIKEEYRTSLRATYNNVPLWGGYTLSEESERTVPGIFNYNLTTPARIKGGVAFFAGKQGFISSDIEVVGYNNARLGAEDNFLMHADNLTIRNIYKPGVNLSLGGELRTADIFRLRGGVARIGDPYKKGVLDDLDRSVYNVSLGAGVRTADYYFDVAMVKTWFQSAYSPYTLSSGLEPVAFTKNRNTNFIISAGTYF